MESARCRAFIASADEGSFTAAGRVLDYTPSGVSQLVRALEEELGLILLSRKNRGVSLTRDGERMYPQILDFLKREESMFDMARNVSELTVGTITIATFTSIATHILPRIIRGFSHRYGNIGIRIAEGSKASIEEMLADNRADLAFVSRIDNPGYSWLPFMRDRIVAVLPPDHRLAGSDSYPVSECMHDDLIMSDQGQDLDVISLLKDSGIEPEIKFSTIENYTAINMAGRGLGVNIVNEFITKSWQSDCVILPLDPPAEIEYGIMLPSAEASAPVVRRFVSYAMMEMKGMEF